ncbi:hypothetical protein DPMN_100399 [Dreissena polymorpha]|uniref:Uncharacterized protein n=1 Tax=Dreissena polymorpha TaxID=45954 RepID=A0A9D4LHC0_DREPO|nr:hypothetical protein DPMN_100399 [Dreissena polymorpha]
MTVSTERSKTMMNSTNNTSKDIANNDEKLKEVTSFNYFSNPIKGSYRYRCDSN